MSNIKNTESALQGVRVLDLTHYIAGPYCTKLLADFGADVIKVERPGTGDPARNMGPFFHDEPEAEKSLPFLYLNTNKRSITLDLKSATGSRILKQLVKDSDVLVENFAPRVMPSLGLSYENLKSLNPSLIMVSISNFGQTGPYRDYLAADIVEYALGGLMYIFGYENREPLKHALNQTQYKAGTNAASATAIAMFGKQFTGEGQHIDISIQECMTTALRDTTSLYAYMGGIRQRARVYTGEMPRTPVEVKDGQVVPISFGGVMWQAVAEFLDAPDLNDEKFSTPELRLSNAKELHDILMKVFSRWEKFELFYEAHKRRGFIYGVVQSPKEVFENPQYSARGYFVNIEHPVIGEAKYPGAPFIMSETPWQARTSAPMLGQHNQEIICEGLGYTLEELARLRAAGVI